MEPRGPGLSARFARLQGAHPAAAFAWALLAGFAVLAAGIVALGWLVTRVLLDMRVVVDADEYLPERLAAHRTPDRNALSHAGSLVGDIPVLPALVIAVVIVALVLHRARVGVFLAAAALMELSLYRIGALAAPRERPDVTRLDTHLPMDESFPSGHVAASTVVYAGIALLVASHWDRSPWIRRAAWSAAVLAVATVAVSRMYRGMHHPMDVLSGLLLGAGCLLVALVAVRAYGHARRAHEPTEETS